MQQDKHTSKLARGEAAFAKVSEQRNDEVHITKRGTHGVAGGAAVNCPRLRRQVRERGEREVRSSVWEASSCESCCEVLLVTGAGNVSDAAACHADDDDEASPAVVDDMMVRRVRTRAEGESAPAPGSRSGSRTGPA